MRFIDNTDVQPPVGWQEKAAKAAECVKAGTHSPDDFAKIWQTLKDKLADLSHDKCWYCESHIPRSDNAVDHYRPKGTIRDANPPHPGYKWKAFELQNFRYSCTFCNEKRNDKKGTSGGKWNYFPLLMEAKRAIDEAGIEYERPVLLDPCQMSNCGLIAFDTLGAPFAPFNSTSDEYIRVIGSIRLLHLDQQSLNEARRGQWVQLELIVKDAKRWYLKRLAGIDGAEFEFDKKLKEIYQWIKPSNKIAYTGYLVYKLKSDAEIKIHPWIESIVSRI